MPVVQRGCGALLGPVHVGGFVCNAHAARWWLHPPEEVGGPSWLTPFSLLPLNPPCSAGPAALSLPEDAYPSYLSFPSALSEGFPSAYDEGPRLPTPEHRALLRTLSDEEQSTPTRLFAGAHLPCPAGPLCSLPLS